MKSIYIEQSAYFIDEVGYTTLAKDLDVTPQAVFNWKTRGIPKSYLKYLNIAYQSLINKYESLKVVA